MPVADIHDTTGCGIGTRPSSADSHQLSLMIMMIIKSPLNMITGTRTESLDVVLSGWCMYANGVSPQSLTCALGVPRVHAIPFIARCTAKGNRNRIPLLFIPLCTAHVGRGLFIQLCLGYLEHQRMLDTRNGCIVMPCSNLTVSSLFPENTACCALAFMQLDCWTRQSTTCSDPSPSRLCNRLRLICAFVWHKTSVGVLFHRT